MLRAERCSPRDDRRGLVVCSISETLPKDVAVVGAQGRIGATTFAGSGIIESFLKMLDPVIAATHWILTAIVILSIGHL